MAEFQTERGAVATLALTRPRIPWGAVETDAFGHVVDFIEAPPSPYLVNADVYAFSAAFAALLPTRGDHGRTASPDWPGNGVSPDSRCRTARTGEPSTRPGI